MRPLYQWSLSLSNQEGLVSSLQLCSKEHLAPPSGCGQALVVSTTGGRVILTFLPEDLPTTWDDREQPRQPSKAPRLSTTSTANGRTRLSAASRVSETGRVSWVVLNLMSYEWYQERPWVLESSTIRSSPMSAAD
ncbi:hypothetical protein FOZ63_011462 [Perkinsus olseni]|uniref:Uncharacterized protein n=2 Tax=Perkinsus olseni TaxID=32597 RepID=A0A7J6UDV6_PEROL|nr:hypothetical protein FOZ62_005374 [Perkinsus olseni]KAF4755422.1 hypothetical protein FOZ63_011462 [Perkinsus olseni]